MPSSPTQTWKQLQAVKSGPPIDYSFKDIKIVNGMQKLWLAAFVGLMLLYQHTCSCVADLLHEEPASGKPSHSHVDRDTTNINEYLDQLTNIEAQPSRDPETPLNSNSVRICNNHLLSLKGLDRVLHHVLDDPMEMVVRRLHGFMASVQHTCIHPCFPVIVYSRMHHASLHGSCMEHVCA